MQVVKTKASSHKTAAKPPKPKDCPYCKSELSASEKDFFPCSCTFQACGNCYEDILGNKGLCPSCHKQLRTSRPKAVHTSKKEELHKADIDKINKEKTQKKHTVTTVVTTVSAKHGAASSHSHTYKPDPRANLPKMSFSELSKLRIIQRNLIYIIGLAPQIAKPEVLEKNEYFGQYGKINKIVVNKGNAYNSASANGPSFSAYITFAKEIEASIAILAADQYVINDRTLRTSYGTTKYCTFFLKGQSCPNSDCLYLHTCENKEELLIKDETLSNKEIFMDQQKLTLDFIEKHYDEVMKKISLDTPKAPAKTMLPSVASVQQKAKKLIEQRIKDRQLAKEAKARECEKSRSRGDIDDCNKENRNSSNFDLSQSGSKRSITDDRTSHQDTESARGSLSPQKNVNRQESKAEGTSEAALHSHRSHRSTSSNWSTTDNSLKKDIGMDNKEDLETKISPKMQPDRKNTEDAESLRKGSSCSIKPKSSKKDDEDDGFKDLFDKTVYERITRNIYGCKVSRFGITQEEEGEQENQRGFDEENKNGEYEEFADISRSITDFVICESETNSDTALSSVENREAPSPLSTSTNKESISSAEKFMEKGRFVHPAVEIVNNHNKNMMKAKSDKIKGTESPTDKRKNEQKGGNGNTYKNSNGESDHYKHHATNKSVEFGKNHTHSEHIHHQRSSFSKGVTQKLSNFY